VKKVVILLPTFNEKDNIEGFINDVFDQEKNSPGWKYEILVVDSNSPDGTYKLAQAIAEKNSRVHTLLVGRGLGVAIIEGHQYAMKNLRPDALAQLDADGQVDPDVLPKLLKTLDDGYNLALGSRFVEGGKNNLSLMRRIFSQGASIVFRVLVGPSSIKEVTNSARAFTPELFKKINLERLPWKDQTFIIQPAFLHEAILAGAKYKEVPLIFKNREEGYSKNKTFNYTYDVIAYSIDARLHLWGINIPFYKLSRRAKTLFKFGMVGFVGTIIDFAFYKIFINYFNIPPATAKAFSTEIAIFNNFLLNNYWTFRSRKTTTNIFQRFGIFNLVSLGGLLIAVIIIKVLHTMYGDSYAVILGKRLAYNNFYFLATIPFVLVWNFTVNHFVTWRKKKEEPVLDVV
jgi:dolichol-phosphate mannosyltransferase